MSYCHKDPCCCRKVHHIRKRPRRRQASILPLIAGVLFLLTRNNGPANNRNVNIVNIGSDDENVDESDCECDC